MKKVVMFKESYGIEAHEKLNTWLSKNPTATLIDIKPVVRYDDLTHDPANVTMFAIVDMPKREKKNWDESPYRKYGRQVV